MSVRNLYPQQRPTLNLNFAQSKILDPRITFTRTSTATYVDENGLIKTVANDIARFDHDPVTGECLGLLIEEQRQNLVRNNTMQGAVAGTPGTAPTYWSLGTTSGGITREIVGVGEEDGISYVDIRWSGTVTTNPIAYWSFNPESDNSLFPGTRTSRYTFSNYIKVVGGTVPTSSTFIMVYYNMNSSFQNLSQYQVLSIPLSNTIGKRLVESRYSFTNTDFPSTDTAYFRPYYQWNFSFNEVIDVTLRIGMPQVELGSFATSVIPTSGSTITRTPDNARIEGKNFTDFYNPSEGTILWTGRYNAENINLQCYSIDPSTVGGDSNNRIALFGRAGLSGGTFVPRIRSSGNNFDPSAVNINFAAGISNKCGLSYNLNSSSFSVNSLPITTSTPTSLPLVSVLKIGSDYSGSQFANGTISKLTYYPSRLPNEQLQNLTK